MMILLRIKTLNYLNKVYKVLIFLPQLIDQFMNKLAKTEKGIQLFKYQTEVHDRRV